MSVILYVDSNDWDEIQSGALHGYIRSGITLYASEEVGPDWEAEGKVKIEIQRV
jgi:hypothetical protein